MRRLSACAAGLTLLSLFAAFVNFAGLQRGNAPMEERGWRLLAPDDAGGLIFRRMLSVRGEGAALRDDTVTPVADCCSSSAQWALSAERVDAAVVCPDAARHLVEKDGRYEVTGPCLSNADVLVVRPENESPKAAMMQNRQYQAELLAALGVSPSDIAPMLPMGVPYALEKGFTGKGIVDVLTALGLRGQRMPVASGDVVTYVLVVRRDFRTGPEWGEFARLYNECAAALNADPAQILQEVRGIKLEQEGIELWRKLRVTFALLSEEKQ